MKKIAVALVIFILCGLNGGCAKKNLDSKSVLGDDYFDGYVEANFDLYNSPAKENGLGGTFVWCEGVIKNVVTSSFTYAEFEGGGGIWHVTLNIFPVSFYDKFVGKRVIVRGAYGGFSQTFKQPIIQAKNIYDIEKNEVFDCLDDEHIYELIKKYVQGNDSLDETSLGKDQKSEATGKDGQDSVLMVKDTIKKNYDTNFGIEALYAISDKNYKMYHDILDALNADYSKSEDEILAGLTGKYGMSVSHLKAFMRENMEDAIDRDFGKTIGETTISDMQVIECGKQVILNTIENSGVKIPSDIASWDISKTGLRYVLKCSFEDDELNSNEAIIKIEFNKDYSNFTLFQLKYNGVNIEL